VSLTESLRAAQLPPPAQRRAIRLRAGATLTDVGDELGVSAVAVSRWESGTRSPRRDLAQRYAVLLADLRALRQSSSRISATERSTTSASRATEPGAS
jgi:transcriptional regulator with XRE-family HTH domain